MSQGRETAILLCPLRTLQTWAHCVSFLVIHILHFYYEPISAHKARQWVASEVTAHHRHTVLRENLFLGKRKEKSTHLLGKLPYFYIECRHAVGYKFTYPLSRPQGGCFKDWIGLLNTNYWVPGTEQGALNSAMRNDTVFASKGLTVWWGNQKRKQTLKW